MSPDMSQVPPEPQDQQGGRRAHRMGVAVALVTSLLTVWTTIVRDDGSGMTFFLLIMAAAVGGFAARFQPAGLARAMLGVAVMQGLLGIAIATAPSTASLPDSGLRVLAFCGFFAALWLIAAALFLTSAKADRAPPSA